MIDGGALVRSADRQDPTHQPSKDDETVWRHTFAHEAQRKIADRRSFYDRSA
jgi:hypothetical protein